MEKATLGFRIYKIWLILKRFAGTFHQAQTLKLGGVYCEDSSALVLYLGGKIIDSSLGFDHDL